MKGTIFLILFCLLSMVSACDFTIEEKDKARTKPTNLTYKTEELAGQRGMELFNQHCASCHDFSDNGMGPNLSGVTRQVDKAWLIAFIHNPVEVIESGDERAVELFKKYKQYMPPFPTIKGEDLEYILAFIHKFSEGEKRNKNNRKGGLINPIPKKIPFSDLTLVLEKQFIAPTSSEIGKPTRINKLERAPRNRLFIHDLRGKLYEIKKDNSLSEYLDVANRLPNFIDNPGKGTGFGSWAFHPDFEQNGLFYTTHNEPSGIASADFPIPDSIKVTVQAVLTEWKTNNAKAAVFSGSHRELLRADMVTGAHCFQELTFNPIAKPNTADYGLLYLGIGDGGAELRNYAFLCGNTENIWGSIIRIDPTGDNSANGNYGIPADNPFLNTPKALGEIWAMGFRNPHRISWDETGTGKMFISNIGQHSLEEINIGIAGADYGWPSREGSFLFDTKANRELVYPLPTDDANFVYPVIQYDHDEGTAVSGGYVYAGTTIPVLQGKYIFGDISRGTLFYSEVAAMNQGQQAPIYKFKVSLDRQLTDLETIVNDKRAELRLGMDHEGELYIFSKSNGTVYKVVDCTMSDL